MVSLEKHRGGNNTKAYYCPDNEEPYPEVSNLFPGAAASMVVLLPLSLLFFIEGGAVGVLLLSAVEIIGVICGVFLFTRPTKQSESFIPKEFARVSHIEEEYRIEEHKKAA